MILVIEPCTEPDLENESSSITSSMGRMDRDFPATPAATALLLSSERLLKLPLEALMFATAAAAAAAWAATAFCCCSARVFSIQCLRKGRIADDLERLTSICLAAPPAPTPETELAGGERLPTTLACSYDQIFNIKLEC